MRAAAMTNKIAAEYDTGMGTTRLMWEYLSERLDDNKEKLPDSLNQAIYALCEGRAKLVPNA
jgi:hypothetical protein